MRRWIEISVGLLMLLGILGIIVLAAQISGVKLSALNQKDFMVSAQFTSVGDLKVGAAVRVAGVLVGKVDNIHLDSENYQAVVTLELYPTAKKIPDDSSASIRSAGILGDNYVAISPGYNETYLHAGSEIETTYPPVGLDTLISNFIGGSSSGSAGHSSQ